MSVTTRILLVVLALLAVSGVAAAAECPDCDGDGEPDESRYSSYDTGVLADEGGMLVDTDQSVGENEQGRFTWLQLCVRLFDELGDFFALQFEQYASEEGVDVDARVTAKDETVDLEDTLAGDLDDATWDAMEPLPVEVPVDHTDLPEGQDVEEVLDLRGLDAAAPL